MHVFACRYEGSPFTKKLSKFQKKSNKRNEIRKSISSYVDVPVACTVTATLASRVLIFVWTRCSRGGLGSDGSGAAELSLMTSAAGAFNEWYHQYAAHRCQHA